MVKRSQQVWMSPEAKRMAKMKASEKGMSLKDWLDQVVMEEKKELKKKGDQYRFF